MNATDLLDQRDHVLLDFDGPVCSVFGGEISNVRAADCLRSIVKGAVLPAEIANGPDPFAVLRFSAQFENGARLADVAAELERLEREAVRTAPPTVAIARVLDYLASAGHFVTIVSNNSAAAVADFLSRHGLERLARGIAARRSADPSLLKPAPYLVEQAMADASVTAQRCVLIGDSLADLQAAHAVSVPVIVYANKAGKRAWAEEHGAEAVIDSMAELVETASATRER